MAVEVFSGVLVSPASANPAWAITGVGFMPKLLLFYSEGSTTLGTRNHTNGPTIGVALAPGVEASANCYALDAQVTTQARRRARSDSCISMISTSNGLVLVASLVSMDPDGFTLNLSVAGSGRRVYYLAIGGDDITDPELVFFRTPTAPGLDAVTGFTRQHDLIGVFAPLTPTLVTHGDALFSLGFSDGVSQGCAGYGSVDGVATSSADRSLESGAIVNVPRDGATLARAVMDSHDAAGFTLDWSDTPGDERDAFAIGLSGGNFRVGLDTQPLAPGTDPTTGVGFSPRGLVFWGHADTAQGRRVDANFTIGATDGVRSGATWSSDRSGLATTDVNRYNNPGECLAHGAGTASLATAALESLDADGFTLDWLTADAVARLYLYLAIGDAGAPGVTLDVDGASHAHRAAELGLAQTHTLALEELRHAHAAAAAGLVQLHTLDAAELRHPHQAKDVQVDQADALALEELRHAHRAAELGLAQAHTLALEELRHAHTAATVPTVEGAILFLEGLAHAHTAGTVVISESAILAILEATHAHRAGEAPVTQAHVLEVAQALHRHTAATVLVIDDTAIPAIDPAALVVVRADDTTVIVLAEPEASVH